MIPYLNFDGHHGMSAKSNPFENYALKILIYIDEETVTDYDYLSFLYRQSNHDNFTIVSSKPGRGKFIKYQRTQDRFELFNLYDSDNTILSHHAIDSVDRVAAQIASNHNWGRADQIKRAIVASRTAKSLGALFVITGDKILLEHSDKAILNPSIPLNIHDATALIGLIMRMRRNLKIVTEQSGAVTVSVEHGRWSFFWFAARDLLPTGWKLVSSTSQMSDERMKYLALTSMSRVSSALKCRDQIHENLLIEQNNSSVDDAVFYFDYFLINLVACFDVIARVVDEIYLPLDKAGDRSRSVSWRGAWLKHLGKKDSSLSSKMAEKTFNRDVLELIAILRNYIHAEGLTGSQHSRSGKTAPMLIVIPKNVVSSIQPIVKRLWGESFADEYIHGEDMVLEIGDLVERILPAAVRVLNDLINSVDFTRIPGFDPKLVAHHPPADWLGEDTTEDIRKLLGVGDGQK